MSGDNFDKLGWVQKVDYVVGDLLLNIGRGELHSAVGKWLIHYTREAYERGIVEGKKQRKRKERTR